MRREILTARAEPNAAHGANSEPWAGPGDQADCARPAPSSPGSHIARDAKTPAQDMFSRIETDQPYPPYLDCGGISKTTGARVPRLTSYSHADERKLQGRIVMRSYVSSDAGW
jgi:hypothetical protein